MTTTVNISPLNQRGQKLSTRPPRSNITTNIPTPPTPPAPGPGPSLTLPWLLANGIELAVIAAIASVPKGSRRDIGDQGGAVDGTLRLTQQTRKRDIAFSTIPLAQPDAFAWENYLTGEGHVWSFDGSSSTALYGSKGLGPSALTGASIMAGSGSKFGSGALFINISTGTITFTGALLNTFKATPAWTVMVWRFDDGTDTNFHHYAVRSDGAKWRDGVRNDGTSTPWLTVSGANVTLTAGGFVDPVIYSDLVCLPFKVLDTWPPTFGTAAAAFGPRPYLDLTGKMVPEQGSRRVLGAVAENLIASANGTMSRLDITLAAR